MVHSFPVPLLTDGELPDSSFPAFNLEAWLPKPAYKSLEELLSGRIRLGDITISVDGDPVKNFDDLASILERHNVGDKIELGVRRNKKTRTLKFILQAVQ